MYSLGDRDNPRDVDQRGDPHALPDVDERYRQQRQSRVGQPCRHINSEGVEGRVQKAPRRMRSRAEHRADPTMLTNAGKNTTERSKPRVLIFCQQNRRREAKHDLQAARHEGVDDRVAKPVLQRRFPEELFEVFEADPLPLKQGPAREHEEERDDGR